MTVPSKDQASWLRRLPEEGPISEWDIPEHDALILEAEGWATLELGRYGPGWSLSWRYSATLAGLTALKEASTHEI